MLYLFYIYDMLHNKIYVLHIFKMVLGASIINSVCFISVQENISVVVFLNAVFCL